MNIKKDCAEVWKEYEKGRDYLSNFGQYERVEQCENFYSGKQWEGLNAPDLDKPVMNFIHRVVSYFISLIVTDDVGVSIQMHDGDETGKIHTDILSNEVSKVIEDQKLTAMFRENLRDAAVTGNTAAYIYYDGDEKKIKAQLIAVKTGNIQSAVASFTVS